MRQIGRVGGRSIVGRSIDSWLRGGRLLARGRLMSGGFCSGLGRA
jgi:hypothetical protein